MVRLMGVNIALFNLSKVEDTSHPWRGIEEDYRFDSLRYAGDEEFLAWLGENGESRTLGQDRDIEVYQRPQDLKLAREWVKANIVEGNQERWLNLFDLLEADTEKHLWLQAIW